MKFRKTALLLITLLLAQPLLAVSAAPFPGVLPQLVDEMSAGASGCQEHEDMSGVSSSLHAQCETLCLCAFANCHSVLAGENTFFPLTRIDFLGADFSVFYTSSSKNALYRPPITA